MRAEQSAVHSRFEETLLLNLLLWDGGCLEYKSMATLHMCVVNKCWKASRAASFPAEAPRVEPGLSEV